MISLPVSGTMLNLFELCEAINQRMLSESTSVAVSVATVWPAPSSTLNSDGEVITGASSSLPIMLIV